MTENTENTAVETAENKDCVYFSASTLQFYPSIAKPAYVASGTFPDDTVEITHAEHQEFINKRAKGYTVIADDDDGYPTLIDPAPDAYYTLVDNEWVLTDESKAQRLEVAKATKIAAINTVKDELIYADVEYKGVAYQTDLVSMARLIGNIAVGADQISWVASDNTKVTMSLAELGELLASVNTRTSAIVDKAADLKSIVTACETLEEVEVVSIDFS